MRNNELEKELDGLGRVVLPINFRRKLNLKNNSKVFISLENDSIIITPAEKSCALCGRIKELNEDLRICEDCIRRVKNI